MKSNLRIVQVGLGGWGRNWYAQILSSFPGVTVVGFVDPSDESLVQAQRGAKVPKTACFSTLAAALKAVDCDAVLVTASLPGHVPSALTALRAGKHVLVEKPFAPSIAQAKRVVEAAKAAGRIIAVSQNYRYAPAPLLAQKIVAEGSLGKLGSISLDFRRDNVLPDPNRRRHEELPNPLLADMAIHHFDLMRMVTGSDARRISCTTWNPPWSRYVDAPAGAATVEMANGVVVSYRGSWVSPGPRTAWDGEWRMEFEKGEVVWTGRAENDSGDELEIRPYGKKPRTANLPVVKYRDRAGSFAAFVGAVLGRTNPEDLEISGAHNIGSLALTYAAIASASRGRPVDL